MQDNEHIYSYNAKAVKTTNVILSFLIFIIHPLTALLVALKNFNRREFVYLFALFTCFYGYSVVPNSTSNDLNFYLNVLPYYNSLPSSAFSEIIDGVVNQSSEDEADLYRPLMIFMVSRFTDNGHILMAVFGLIYGLFFALSVRLFLKQSSAMHLLFVLVLLTFAFKLPLNLLGGVRYGTGGYLFFYAVISYFNTNKKKYFLLVVCACIIHFAYLPLAMLFFLHLVIKRYSFLYFLMFVVSFLPLNVGQILAGFFDTRAGGGLADKVSGYTSEDNVAEKSQILQAASIQIKLQWIFQEISLYIATVFYYFRRRYNILVTPYCSNLFLFTVLLYSFSNFTKSILSLGERSLVITLMFFAYFLYVLLKDNLHNLSVRILCIIAFILGIIRILISLQSITSALGSEFYFGNFFIS